jgi:hypothetical protein
MPWPSACSRTPDYRHGRHCPGTLPPTWSPGGRPRCSCPGPMDDALGAAALSTNLCPGPSAEALEAPGQSPELAPPTLWLTACLHHDAWPAAAALSPWLTPCPPPPPTGILCAIAKARGCVCSRPETWRGGGTRPWHRLAAPFPRLTHWLRHPGPQTEVLAEIPWRCPAAALAPWLKPWVPSLCPRNVALSPWLTSWAIAPWHLVAAPFPLVGESSPPPWPHG